MNKGDEIEEEDEGGEEERNDGKKTHLKAFKKLSIRRNIWRLSKS